MVSNAQLRLRKTAPTSFLLQLVGMESHSKVDAIPVISLLMKTKLIL